jgi:hypothetical protein
MYTFDDNSWTEHTSTKTPFLIFFRILIRMLLKNSLRCLVSLQ